MSTHATNDRETEGEIMEQLAHTPRSPAMQVHE